MSTKTCPFCAEHVQQEAVKCRHCGSWLEAGHGGFPRRLVRSESDRLLAGICGGLGQYLNLDPTVVRVLVVVLAILTWVLPALLIYLILAFVIPTENAMR